MIVRRKFLALASVVAPVFVITLATSQYNHANAAPLVSLATLPYVALDAECGTCSSCSLGGGEDGHSAQGPAQGANTEGAGWHGNCLAGDCGEKHGATCKCYCASDPDPEECERNCVIVPGGFALGDAFNETWESIRAGRVNAVEFATSHSNVEFNAERRAVQVLGCDGRVIAHIPIPRTVTTE